MFRTLLDLKLLKCPTPDGGHHGFVYNMDLSKNGACGTIWTIIWWSPLTSSIYFISDIWILYHSHIASLSYKHHCLKLMFWHIYFGYHFHAHLYSSFNHQFHRSCTALKTVFLRTTNLFLVRHFTKTVFLKATIYLWHVIYILFPSFNNKFFSFWFYFRHARTIKISNPVPSYANKKTTRTHARTHAHTHAHTHFFFISGNLGGPSNSGVSKFQGWNTSQQNRYMYNNRENNNHQFFIILYVPQCQEMCIFGYLGGVGGLVIINNQIHQLNVQIFVFPVSGVDRQSPVKFTYKCIFLQLYCWWLYCWWLRVYLCTKQA